MPMMTAASASLVAEATEGATKTAVELAAVAAAPSSAATAQPMRGLAAASGWCP